MQDESVLLGEVDALEQATTDVQEVVVDQVANWAVEVTKDGRPAAAARTVEVGMGVVCGGKKKKTRPAQQRQHERRAAEREAAAVEGAAVVAVAAATTMAKALP